MTSHAHKLSSPRRPWRAAAAALSVVLLAAASVARAQSASATLTGTVLDEAGAVVPGVRVTLLNQATALQRHATTNDEGVFVAAVLPPGRYHLTARREGFSTFEVRHTVLHTGDQQALRIRLRVGEIGETVTVYDSLPGVQEATSVSTVVERQFVENLPLNGRSFHSLLELTPGAVLTRASFSEQGQFSVNGQRANSNYFTVDGVSANLGVSAGAAPGQAAGGSLPALTVLGGTNNLVSVDALEEFRVQTSASAPEFGRTSGAQVALVTRSGTNELRGSAFNYFRHESLDANDWFANSRGLARPRVRQHDFGGTLGGPLKKDRAFFFLSHESLRLRQPQTAVTEVPSLAARADAPAALRPLLEAFPRPNGAETGGGLAEFTAAFSDPSRVDATALRVDLVAGDRLTFFARYNFSPSETVQRGATVRPAFGAAGTLNPAAALSLNTLTRTALDTQTLTLGANVAPRPGLVNELRFGWGRARGATSLALDDFGGAVVPPSSLLFPPPAPAGDAAFQLALQGGTNSNLAAGANVANLQRQLNLADNLSVVRGSHQLKLGADYRRLSPVFDSVRYGQSVVYGGVGRPGEAAAGTVLSGRARSVQVFAGAGPRFPVFTNFSAFAQDTWRASRRLTLTYGVRWELNPPPREARGQHALTLLDADAPAARLAVAPRGTPLWRTTFDNFAPRAGFAYLLDAEPGRELVLRGGAGLFHDLGSGQAAQGYGNVAPFAAVRTFEGAEFPLAPEQARPPRLSPDPPFDALVAFDPRLKLPRTYQWNVALARSLGTGQTLTAAYVGALGRELLREDAFVRPNPSFNLVRVTRNAAASRYDALQVQFARRLARGLQALASYTFARSTDDASSDALSRLRLAGDVTGFGTGLDVSTGRGPSDFDVRHSLTAAATYVLPGPAARGAGAALLRGWSIDAILRARTATPVNVVTRTDVLGDGLFVELRRPDLVAGVPVYVEDPAAPGGRRLNRAAFSVPLAARQGTLGYNALRGFPLTQLDLALRRQVALGERLRLDLRAEVFNAFNHPNFGNPVANLSSNLFGLSTQTFARSLGAGGVAGGLSPIYQVGGPRSMQLALKLHF